MAISSSICFFAYSWSCFGGLVMLVISSTCWIQHHATLGMIYTEVMKLCDK
jgi:hypothetical protein